MKTRYWLIMIMFIESGALYSSAIIVELALYFTHSNAIYIIFDAMAQIIVRPLGWFHSAADFP